MKNNKMCYSLRQHNCRIKINKFLLKNYNFLVFNKHNKIKNKLINLNITLFQKLIIQQILYNNNNLIVTQIYNNIKILNLIYFKKWKTKEKPNNN